MLDYLKDLPLPFLVAAGVSQPKLSLSRLIEAGIIAGVTMFGTVQAMNARLDAIKEKLDKVEKSAEEARRVQMEIVPMRNLQVKTLQEAVEKHEARLVRLEAKR